jgi:uncharacterized membrane protein (DUF4010 family)
VGGSSVRIRAAGDGSRVNVDVSPQKLALILGLSFFFGLAYEDFYARRALHRPGGVRTFPLLGLTGTGLYLLEPQHTAAFCAGLLALGAWLFAWYRARVAADAADAVRAPGEEEGEAVGLMAPVCTVLAFSIGPVVLVAPAWLAVALTVGAVFLLGAREALHGLARRIPFDELASLGKFLVLAGIVLPLLPDRPVTTLTAITPHQVWLAVVVVSAISYASYLAQHYLPIERGVLLAAVLGGLYSSTATTVVLARRGREEARPSRDTQAGIVLATALMYLRLALVVAVLNPGLGRALAPALLSLCALGALLAGACYRWSAPRAQQGSAVGLPSNPLELSTAFTFAAAFVAVALASSWFQNSFGRTGLYAMAALVGVTDIDPFVLSVAQGAVPGTATSSLVACVLIAASSNDVLKAVYAAAFGGLRRSVAVIVSLVVLAAAGFALAFRLVAGTG